MEYESVEKESVKDPDTSKSSTGIYFFAHLPELEHVGSLLECGPFRVSPWQPVPPNLPHGTNMLWVGILVSRPRNILKSTKRKFVAKWVSKSHFGNDVFLRMDKGGGTRVVNFNGTIVALDDVWFFPGCFKDVTIAELKRTKVEWEK